MRLKFFIVAIIIAVLVGNVALGLFLQSKNKKTYETVSLPSYETVSYQGVEGKDALMLLKQKALIEQDGSGLVVGINGRKAESSKREYWAFYVNGELAPVGPADYKTKEGDKVEWKIEKY